MLLRGDSALKDSMLGRVAPSKLGKRLPASCVPGATCSKAKLLRPLLVLWVLS